MIIAKTICGIPIAEPINRFVTLSQELKDHAEEMIQAAKDQIPRLKSTSVPVFKHEFLQREGKLSSKESKINIHVEHKPQDLLLQTINWGLSVVKLPWLEKVIYVEWL